MQNALRKNIGMSEYKYFSEFSRKLVTSKINPTCYWSILKSFLNKKKSLIPHLIHTIQSVVDFKEKKTN